MARIVITGGSLCGLTAAALLAEDGHDVVVLERDPAAPPEDVEVAWAGWERAGVNQFRMIHYFQPRWREAVESELPALAKELEAAGAARWNPLDAIPDRIKGGTRPGDDEFGTLTGRRPMVEAALARVVAAYPNVTVRRGAGVAGLLTAGGSPGSPHVAGVRTEQGDDVAADLVVDATGRRSPLPRWLDAIGAPPLLEEEEDTGFVYYARHFRSPDGSVPVPFGGQLQSYRSISTLTLPCDNGTWGVALIASGADAELRGLKDTDTWMRTVAAFPFVAHWLQGEPIDDVAVMARIPDRYRRLVVDGEPVATGVVPVGDAWACTNPSLGRGASIGMVHVLGLRDVLRSADLADRRGFALAFDEMTEERVAPWYRATLEVDRHRLAQIEAEIESRPYEPDDPGFELFQAWQAALTSDPDVLRGFFEVVGVRTLPHEVLARPGLLEAITRLGGGWREARSAGPSRAELLAVVRG